MADISPFRGIRYVPSAVGDLSMVIAPPYDVISSAQQDQLYRRHSHNIVRLILGKKRRGDCEGNNEYTRAAEAFTSWLAEGVLRKDPEDTIYVCDQEFELNGKRLKRRTFIARVRLEEFGTGTIFPHEQTMPGPKADRLKLMKACQANLSQIFAIYPDEDGAVALVISRATDRAPEVEIQHVSGEAKCCLWCCSHPPVIDELRRLMSDKPLYIADGHHRYETALHFHHQRGGKPDAASAFVMMACVSMQDPGLVILPTHRLVRDLAARGPDEFLRAAADDFDVVEVDNFEELLRTMAATDGRVIGVGLEAGKSWRMLNLRPGVEVIAPGRSRAWRHLDVTILHLLILEKLLGVRFEGCALDKRLRYTESLREVTQMLQSGAYEAGFLLNPPRVAEVRAVAESGEKMPSKSTYFYPKLLTGLVINDLSDCA